VIFGQRGSTSGLGRTRLQVADEVPLTFGNGNPIIIQLDITVNNGASPLLLLLRS
jgi:hypothetical protein